jgi:hypothetical protein
LQIRKEINSKSPTLSRTGHFVESIRRELGLLRSFMIVHIKRAANSAPHSLAQGVATHGIERFWLEAISPNIYDIVIR